MDCLTLIQWLEGADKIFEALEGRGDTYKLCRKWVDEWLNCGRFCISEEDDAFLRHSFREALKEVLTSKNTSEKVKEKLLSELDKLINNLNRNSDKLAFAFSTYLVSWNISRFKEYVEANLKFDLISYFNSLQEIIGNEDLKNKFFQLRRKHICDNDINETLIRDIFKKIYDKLYEIGINKKEPVGTIKIMHIIAPNYIPLLDNPIAKALTDENIVSFFIKEPAFFFDEELNKAIDKLCNKFREVIDVNSNAEKAKALSNILKEVYKLLEQKRMVEIDSESFISYCRFIRTKILEKCDCNIIKQLEKLTGKSFLKLLDQAFYIRYSIKHSKKLK